jgi:peptidylprolyl isomerase
MLRNLALATALLAAPAGATGIEIDIEGSVEGTVVIDLFEDVAPNHAERMTTLAENGAYDGVVFHRVIDGFMAQTGDVQFGHKDRMGRAGMGGSDMPDLAAEFSDLSFEEGVVGMARSQNPDSANSQFFIMFAPAPHLDGDYTIVGKVTEGMDVIRALKRGDPRSGAIDGDHDVMAEVRVTP